MKKFTTFTVNIPDYEKQVDGTILFDTENPTVCREYPVPACVVNKTAFAADVQRYISIAYADKFQWEHDRLFHKLEKVQNDVTHHNMLEYGKMANHFKPDDIHLEVSLSRIIAFLICKECRVWYYRDGATYKKCGVTFGNTGVDLYNNFVDASNTKTGKPISEKAVTELKQGLQAWFADIINDEACKNWKTDGITAGITIQLVYEAGRVEDRLNKNGITGNERRSEISKFTEQALLKCLKKVLKFEPAPIENQVYVIR